jgi:hypothetical protein
MDAGYLFHKRKGGLFAYDYATKPTDAACSGWDHILQSKVSQVRSNSHGPIRGGGGCRGAHPTPFRPKVPFSGRKCPFCRRVQFSMFVPLLENQNFSPTRKDVESYSQMPGKRILVLELINFSGGGPPVPPLGTYILPSHKYF